MRTRDNIGPIHDVLLICVNYYSEHDTINFVRSLLQQEGCDLLRVIVVDNSGGDGSQPSLLHLVDEEERVELLHSGQNLGYYGGAAWALQEYLGGGAPLPRWVIVSNTDISFPGRDFFSTLFSLYPEKAPAVLAPSIISTRTGVDQNPEIARRPGRARCRLYTWIFRYYPIFTAYCLLALAKNKLRGVVGSRRILAAANGNDRAVPITPIYGPHGSFVVFHRGYFEAGGSLEVGAFMFAETISIAETLERLGLSAVYEPRLRVFHDEHVTMGRFKGPQIARLQWEASVYCFHEFFRES